MRYKRKLVAKSERKSRLERPGRGWKDNVKIDLKKQNITIYPARQGSETGSCEDGN
jgi:hypothetical protein